MKKRIMYMAAVCTAVVLLAFSSAALLSFGKDESPSASLQASSLSGNSGDIAIDLSKVMSSIEAAAEIVLPQLPELILIQDSNCPLPWDGLTVQQYCDYPIKGSVVSAHPIEWVSVRVKNTKRPGSSGIEYVCRFDPAQNILEYNLSGDIEDAEGKTLDQRVRLEALNSGIYEFTLSAGNTAEEQVLYTGEFEVDWLVYKKLTPADFRSNYAYALEFFGGDTDKLLLGYRWPDKTSLSIGVEREWRNKYLTKVEIYGELGYVHKDTVPYLEKAIAYSNSTYIRVHGNGHDSGVILLSNIVEDFAGAFVPRFVRNGGYISHHSLGTALDLNAYTLPNSLNQKNWEIIRSEVQDNLTYNGIKTQDGISYYDFTYSGTSDKYVVEVPRNVQNYLIYELAFYRAGFGWGYYFSHNCDAMHYSLTELPPALHEAEGSGLRKVFEYIP